MTEPLSGPSNDHEMKAKVDEASRQRLLAELQAAANATSRALEKDEQTDVLSRLRSELEARDVDDYGDEDLLELAEALRKGRVTITTLPGEEDDEADGSSD